MAKFVFDIEATGLMNHESIDYRVDGYPLKPSFKIHCIVAQDVDSKRLFCFYDGDKIPVIDKKSGEGVPYEHFPLMDFKRIMRSAESLIGHNIINYDLFAIKKAWGVDYSVGDTSEVDDTVDGRVCFIDDTLVKSKLLNPDRFGGHGLAAWGRALNFHKGDYGKEENAWDKFTPEMLAYCIQDVRLNMLVHEALIKEWGDWDWVDAYCLEKATKELITRSEQRGFKFDKALAEWCIEDLTEKLQDIAEKVEPRLPRTTLPKSKQPNFPANPFNADGSISSHGWNWLEFKLGYNVNRDALNFTSAPKRAFKDDGSVSKSGESFCIKAGVTEPSEFANYIRSQIKLGTTLTPLPPEELAAAKDDLRNKKMPDITTPMKLANQKEIKEYLVTMGWNPLVWSEADMTLDSNKRKLTQLKFEERIERYVAETLESPFCQARCEHFKCSPEGLRDKLYRHDIKRPLKRLGSPKFTVDMDKTIDPNLILLGDKVDWVGDVVMWLTYRHRKNSIYSPPNESKKTTSGWLANGRLLHDGRIPTPADTCGAASARFTHIDVANIPRVSSIYGEHMRGLFGVSEGYVQIGMDFDSLEAKVESHFCWKHDAEDKDYCLSLVRDKPLDIHSVTAQKIGTDRGTAKSAKYCLAYGGQPPTLAKTIGKPLPEAQNIFNLYWEAAKPLADVKEEYTGFWKKQGNKSYIVGIDGRKLFARSEHSITNLLFQNCGSICAKRSAIWWDRKVQEEKLKDANLLICYHDENQMEDLKSNIQFKMFDSEEDAQAWKDSYQKKTGKILSDIGKRNGQFFVAYSRVGELASLSCKYASDYYNLNIDLSGGYIVGLNWSDCH